MVNRKRAYTWDYNWPRIGKYLSSFNQYTFNDLIKNMIYNIDYRSVKEVSDIVYKIILINLEYFKKDLNGECPTRMTMKKLKLCV